MPDKADKLITFTTRIRQMILAYKKIVNENQQLHSMVNEKDEKIKQLESELALAQKEYTTLKTARMLQVADHDMDAAKKKLAKLIRDVDRCITMLNKK